MTAANTAFLRLRLSTGGVTSGLPTSAVVVIESPSRRAPNVRQALGKAHFDDHPIRWSSGEVRNGRSVKGSLRDPGSLKEPFTDLWPG
ncbi:hypothetical protein GCM10017790_69670 [Amycolatopsis oliviviridis]|uniref:Uncharacterized protein n=1 Tax=Amycolatopsis oliviviridis TaxID=1471590 RepID=A0ABQ3M616_9PSEU|nr:hypothetical protein GCM10017790_69670 [Amycolatopsis oliviviridis]